ncbi:LPS assembly lipoprotein LptE [Desulfosarcina ovata]|uniref:Lipoprotein n=2 Tax=Desulfosarcina ovata TaxID=83564 RepID=A0A5K8A953_9BACT|nr:LPS assembly lipoprotein LptE [Desulfosarcina ovata]BBO81762.1 hypothetical protein DSCO28_23280 [Desulfosarcina ovata subsp. sediminis]BBO89011.1 hypothetical protein DSCOOX_21910 [Desulfosarcina ovata subsp. ovata]
MKNRWKQILAAACVVVLTACGYHFSGGGSFPGGVSRIFITMLENRSSESGVESIFTNDLIYEFTRKREAAIAKNKASADAILSGTISLSTTTISRSSVSTAVEKRVVGTLNLRLVTPDGRTFWSSGSLSEQQAYTVEKENETATDQNESEAIAEVSEKLAEAAFSLMTDNF